MQYLKREHFNRWYNLGAYFCALSVATLPLQILLGFVYLTIIYFFSYQPLEIYRFSCFVGICCLTGAVSESFGLLVSSTFNTVVSVSTQERQVFSVPTLFGFSEQCVCGPSTHGTVYNILSLWFWGRLLKYSTLDPDTDAFQLFTICL